MFKLVRGHLICATRQDISDGRLLVSDYQRNPRAQIKNFETRLKQATARGTQSFRSAGRNFPAAS